MNDNLRRFRREVTCLPLLGIQLIKTIHKEIFRMFNYTIFLNTRYFVKKCENGKNREIRKKKRY